ncbi:sulfite reductase flavo protein alpha-component [Aaosphaeria arxii CBS 175.79]|uniref:NADPH--hemoprotein reductase n=1 Tax=Aaosphaeria arxii CBS 175.79 TaxID=1450172 RepID=A0A6A5YAS9_9PLEO|nr:sulfite reductase flavo protein alpha-component [Aaosphaeria arxii CBS 175.79]KAF2021694.1 sulfite reductase flavo protein alpha-component [Aaosphaeria arxii CBS 175.79]
MSIQACPVSGMSGSNAGGCPAGRMGPRGCAFAAFQPNMGAPTVHSAGAEDAGVLYEKERKALNEMLMPEAPARQVTHGLKNADPLQPEDDDLLAMALGAPARRVLMRAEEIGPRTGWKDGYLSSEYGFLPPDPSDSPVALRASPGRIWSDLCERMPGVVARGAMREAILQLPLVHGTPDVIPDRALWAATVCLGILASVYRYEEANDGSEGVSIRAPPGAFRNITGEADDEEEETKGIPRNIAIPLRHINTRMGRALPHLTQFDVSIYNYKLRDPTSVQPYVARTENMDLRWPVFNDRGEAMFLLCMAEVHGCFQHGIESVTRCQEHVMNRDTDGLLQELIHLKSIVDQLAYVFHKISVNPSAGEQFANPVEWGQRYAKFSAPLSKRVPALSGLALPLFLLLDAFIGRTKYKSFLGIEAVHLRRWLPLNIRAFIAAVENHYRIPEFVKSSGDPRLEGVLEGIIESYAGERGFMGTHRYKVYGFLEVVAKTGRTETNGNAGAGDSEGRAWEEVHRTLSDSMKERLDPYRGEVKVQPHEMRGSFEECRFQAKILDRQNVDADPQRSTGMVTFDLHNTGITFQPGDRLAVMPINPSYETAKVAAALGLDELMELPVPVEQGSEWARFSKHLETIYKKPTNGLSVHQILKRGHLAPLTKDLVISIHQMLRASSQTTLKILASDSWPVKGSIGDLLQTAIVEVPQDIWDQAFDLSNLSWLPKLIKLEVPRTYSISNAADSLLPSMIDLTVSRTESARDPLFQSVQPALPLYGVSSGFLNPSPQLMDFPCNVPDDEGVLIGVSRPIQFQLPPSSTVPVAMFAGGSGIAPFRGFWQARSQTGIGRNIMFLGVQSREKFLHEAEMRGLVQQGVLELHTAFSRDRRGLLFDPSSRDLIEHDTDPCYVDTTIVEQGRLVSELVMSKSQGGLGGYLYICGSVSVYETVMSGIRQAIYKHAASTHDSADTLLATAFAERRFMLDIFMTPRAISSSTPTIPMSKLAVHTGHRKGSRMWIGVHGGVYDVTDFLPMHPGGTLIVAGSAGLDASKTFDDLAHTSNPEVSSLLSKYFIGHLGGKPDFRSTELSHMYDQWYQYLRTTVETLTTLSFETNNIMEDSKVWFSGGLFNIGGVRKFYQFQSRLMQGGFSTLFGAKLQEIYLKLSYSLANSIAPNVRLPDIIGTITRAQASPNCTKAMTEISEIGQFVCNSSKSARFHENGILKYAQTVTELDIQFIEQVRDEIASGMDAFDLIAAMDEPANSKQVKLASYLITILERVAARLEGYYSSLSQESIYHPEIENNPARTRWNNIRHKIRDGSFFVLATPPAMLPGDGMAAATRARNGAEVDFAQIFTNAQQALLHSPPPTQQEHDDRQHHSLADMHTARATQNAQAPSTFEMNQQSNAIRRMSNFINSNMSNIRRLSRLPAEYDFAQVMAVYGKQPQPTSTAPRMHTKSPSMSVTQGLRTRAATNASPPLPAPQPLRTRNPQQPNMEQQFLSHTSSPAPPASNPMSAAMTQLNRRQPPRSSTPLPASPRASLALNTARPLLNRRNLSGDEKIPPMPVLASPLSISARSAPGGPTLPAGLRALKLGSMSGDELRFQRVQQTR